MDRNPFNNNPNDPNNRQGGGGQDGGDAGAQRLDQGAGAARSGRASFPQQAGGYGRGEEYDSDDSDSVEPMRPWATDPEFKAMRMADPSPRVFQSSPGLMGPGKDMGMLQSAAPQGKMQFQPVEPMADDRYNKPVIKRNTWANPVLVEVPMYHKVDPYHIELECTSNNDLTATLDTLSDIFRRESVQANCFSDPIKAALLSMDNNELQLSVWRSASDKSKIVVEIQRCRGDLMHCIRKAESILEALKQERNTGNPVQPSQSDSAFELHPSGLEKIEELLRKANAPAQQKQDQSPSSSPRSSQEDISATPLEMVHTLLLSDRWDSRRLGLESLLIMSDPRRSDLATVIETGYAVLLGEQGRNAGSTAELIHGVILRIVLQRKFKEDDPRAPTRAEIDSMDVDQEERVNFLSDDEDDDAAMDDDEGEWIEAAGVTWPRRSDYDEYMSGLFHIALSTLTNAISVVMSFCGHSGGGQTLLQDQSATFIADRLVERAQELVASSDATEKGDVASDSLIPVLLRCIRRAHNKHPNATLACMCLRYLCKHSETIRRSIAHDDKATELVRKARKIGKECHQQLAAESLELLRALAGQSRV